MGQWWGNNSYHSVHITCDFGPHDGRLLTRDQNSISLYRSCYSGPLKCGTWVLARDTTVLLLFCLEWGILVPILEN